VPRDKPTIADVARVAGVSKGLVSFALNDRPGVAAETRHRILGVAKDLGWRPSVRARSLSIQRAFALGLVIARDSSIIAADPFYPALISGIEAALGPIGQALVLSVVADEAQETASYRRLAADGRVDGIIITDLRHNDDRIALAIDLGLSAVTLGHPDIDSPFPAVTVDDGPGIRAAVNHLASLGHSRMAHVGGPGRMLHARRRSQAFAETLSAWGLPGGVVIETDFTAADGARATREILALAERPTAIVYSNDPMAIAGMGVAQRLGLRVPDDLSITGFDGSDVGKYINPSLTTVSTAAEEWGRAAGAALLRVIAGDHVDDIDLPAASLEIRESSAAPGGVTSKSPARPPAKPPTTPPATAK
jgi:DNA-binding LacI/PurR family transcriptional regulator